MVFEILFIGLQLFICRIPIKQAHVKTFIMTLQTKKAPFIRHSLHVVLNHCVSANQDFSFEESLFLLLLFDDL